MNSFLDDLYRRGAEHDAAEPDRRRHLSNLDPATAELLATVVRIARARDVVEIGTGNGWSAIWLAQGARDTGGHVTTVDVEEWPGVAGNLSAAGVSVERVIADGGAYLAGRADAEIDLLFLDAEHTRYAGWWPHPARVLRPGGVLVVDDPDAAADFLALAEESFIGGTAAVGKGLYLGWLKPRL
ncbi:class I SAM-dependent methyltransferase [Actinoplanes sp. NPDC049596]|uniref:O-methyltransferase n=1 Tax=unclassified Actinoplanes TaxID=2626549 RepID=UPI00341E42CB